VVSALRHGPVATPVARQRRLLLPARRPPLPGINFMCLGVDGVYVIGRIRLRVQKVPYLDIL